MELRRRAGLTQRQLATKLRRERNLVARLELGERRLDVVEFFRICRSTGTDPEKAARELMRKLKAVEASESKR